MRVNRPHVSKQEEVGARPHVHGFPNDDRPRLDGTQRHGERVELAALDGAGFSIAFLLTADECNELVRVCEHGCGGFVSVATEFPKEERDNSRVMVLDRAYALSLWQRLAPHLRLRDTLFVKPVGFGNEGVWRPTRVNECLKVSRYGAGERFSPHYDGPWVPRPDESSINTLLIYLSSVPEGMGGETLFFDSPDTDTPLVSVRPEQGNAVVFFHDTYHSSAAMRDGAPPKYVLRTEVMYTRINPDEYPRDKSFDTLPEYHRMVRMYAGSMAAFHAGDIVGFTSGYKEALAIQRDASVRPRDAQRFGAQRLPLPADVMVYILRRVDLATLMSFSRASKAFREIAFDGRVWRDLLRDVFGPEGSLAALGVGAWAAVDPCSNYDLAHELNLTYFSEFRRQMGVLRNRVQTVVVDPGYAFVKMGFISGWDAENNTFDEQLVSLPNACQGAVAAYHYRTYANMRFGQELRPNESSQPVVLRRWELCEAFVMREMIMAAKRMHTSRTSSPHVCVYLEPPVYIEQAKRSLISEALGGETAGQCSVVFVGILSLLLTHYETKSAIVLGMGAGQDYVALVTENETKVELFDRQNAVASAGLFARTIRKLRGQQQPRCDCARMASVAHTWLVEAGLPADMAIIFAGGASVDALVEREFAAQLRTLSAGRTRFAVLNAPRETAAQRSMIPTQTALRKSRSLLWFRSNQAFADGSLLMPDDSELPLGSSSLEGLLK